MLMRYFYHYENHINFPKFQNKDINPCKLNTITIIIINHGNKMDKPDKHIDIYQSNYFISSWYHRRQWYNTISEQATRGTGW